MSQQTPTPIVDLVRRAADGDEGAWDAIVTRYSGLLWSVVRSFRLGDQQAADVVQTTWLRLVENLGRIRDPERLPAWLALTARRLSVDALRNGRRFRSLEDDYEVASTQETPEVAVLRFEREALVRNALERLPARDQQLLTLLVASPPIPYQEISARLGMPVGSIGPTRMRALRRLRAELERASVFEEAAP